MAKIQTRKSISISGTTYTHFKEYCRQHGETMSGVTEDLLHQLLEGSKPLTEGFNVTGTCSGRIDCTKPNLSNAPKSSKVLGSRPLQPGQKAPSPPVEMDEDTRNHRAVHDKIFTF